MQQTSAPTFLDNPNAPEFFVSSLAGLAAEGPNIRLTFASNRTNHTSDPAPTARVVNLRVVMSAAALHDLTLFLGKWQAASNLIAAQKPEGADFQ